jgi:hypothetical protein
MYIPKKGIIYAIFLQLATGYPYTLLEMARVN